MLTEALERIRKNRPLVHCITNYVTANDCANLLLAAGASPIMADDPDEAEEIAGACAGLVINMGTPNPRKLKAMRIGGRRANELGVPVVLDPVGVAASGMRLNSALEMLREIQFSVIRANGSEAHSLLKESRMGGGLDAKSVWEDDVAVAMSLSKKAGCAVILTGKEDIVTDGTACYRVRNGHPMMGLVTGAGCQLSALTGAFAAVNRENILVASLSAVCAMGICGELAAERMNEADGNASFRNYMIDAMYRLNGEKMEARAKYEKC